jgi:hypothetical protein
MDSSLRFALRIVYTYKHRRQTVSKCVSSTFHRRLQTVRKQVFGVSCFTLEMESNIQCVDVFLDTSSVCRELLPRQVPSTLQLDILQPVIHSNTSTSVGVILITFLKPAPSSAFKSTKKLSPYLVLSLRSV